jgi:hypothetical protein
MIDLGGEKHKMARQIEIPDDLAKFLDEWALKMKKRDAQSLAVHVLDQFRNTKLKPIRNEAADAYGQRWRR